MHELAPIAHRQTEAIDWAALSDAAVRFKAHENLGAMLLKGGRHADFAACIAGRLQGPAADSPRVQRHGGITWLWQGPREWLLLSDTASGESLVGQFSGALAGYTAAAIDVSDRVLALEIEGPSARAIIARGTTLDLAQLTAHSCCRTRFAGLHATLFRLDDAESYGLIVDRALRVHLHAWLQQATANERP